MPYVGGGMQGMGILEDNRSPFQLGGFAGVSDPAISEVIRWMESVTGINAGTTYDNGVFGGGDPTVFGMSATPSLSEAQSVKSAIAGIANRDPGAIVAGLGSSNAFLKKIAMAAIIGNFDNGMGGLGQGYAIYASQPAYQSAIKAAWLAANNNDTGAWTRLVEQPRIDALINQLFLKSNFGLGSPFRVENNRYVRDLVTDKIVGDITDPAFNIDALVASVKDRELARVKAQTTPEDAAQSIANTVASTPVATTPSTARQNAPTYIAPGGTTASAMPASLPTQNVPPASPTTVKQLVEDATTQSANIPSSTGGASGGDSFIPASAGGATTAGGSYLPAGAASSGGVETAVPVSGVKPVLNAGDDSQKKMLLAGAGVLALFLFMRKGK